MQKLAVFLLAIACLFASELKYVNHNGGRQSFFDDIQDLKDHATPNEVMKITIVNTNPTGYPTISSKDLAQLKVIERFPNLKAFELNLSYNSEITTLKYIQNIFDRSTYLNTVSLQFVECSIQNAYAIQNLFQYSQNLAAVDIVLMTNKLQHLYFLQQAFQNNQLLRALSINVEENKIQNLDGLEQAFKTPVDLYSYDFEASHNPIEYIDSVKSYLHKVKTVQSVSLILDYNQIEDISALKNAFSQCQKLQNLTVDINHGRIYNYQPLAETVLPKSVTHLDLQTERCNLVTNPQENQITFTNSGTCSTSQRSTVFLGW